MTAGLRALRTLRRAAHAADAACRGWPGCGFGDSERAAAPARDPGPLAGLADDGECWSLSRAADPDLALRTLAGLAGRAAGAGRAGRGTVADRALRAPARRARHVAALGDTSSPPRALAASWPARRRCRSRDLRAAMLAPPSSGAAAAGRRPAPGVPPAARARRRARPRRGGPDCPRRPRRWPTWPTPRWRRRSRSHAPRCPTDAAGARLAVIGDGQVRRARAELRQRRRRHLRRGAAPSGTDEGDGAAVGDPAGAGD